MASAAKGVSDAIQHIDPPNQDLVLLGRKDKAEQV